ncbi:MAG: hypothetical protein EU535_06565 [Promethearchaeota archaeon]|nr:MAG: hypothetical protein EU535_06565 [Candidatus Lokiarchaeota archaeon]
MKTLLKNKGSTIILVSIIIVSIVSIPFLIVYISNINGNGSNGGNGDSVGGGIGDDNNNDDGNGVDNGDEEIILLASGIYTGLNLFAKNLLIPEGNVVFFQNAQIFGGELYVYGNLTIENSVIDHAIYGHGVGLINIINLTVQNWERISLYENSKAIIKNITRYDDYPLSGVSCDVYDNSNLTISDSKAGITIFHEGMVNATSLSNGSSIGMYSNSRATVKSSNLTGIYCYEQPQVYILQNTVVNTLTCYGTSVDYPYNRAKIFKDGTSRIELQYLYDEAQVINI